MSKRFIFYLLLLLLTITGCQEKQGNLVFPDLNPYEVESIILVKEKGDYKLEFKKLASNKWVVKQTNQQFCADKKAIFNFLNMVAYARYIDIAKLNKKKVEKSESAKKSVGTRVVIGLKNKKFDFCVKKAGDDYQSSYLLLNKDETCIRCCPYLNSIVNYPLQKWIEKCVFDLPVEKVKSIQILLNNNVLTHWSRRSRFYPWKNEIDRSVNISSESVERFYNLMNKLRIYNGLLYEENKLYGLQNPRLIIKINDFDQNITQIKVGLPKNSSFYYATRFENYKDEIVLISSTWIKKIQDILSDILNKKLVIK